MTTPPIPNLTAEELQILALAVIRLSSAFGGETLAVKKQANNVPRDEFGFSVNVGSTCKDPCRICQALASRDELIFTSFNGNNHAELSKEYNLSVRAVYKALARYRSQQDDIINQLVNAIAAGKPILQEEARELLLSAEPMLYRHTLTQLSHKLSILNLCNKHGRGKRHD